MRLIDSAVMPTGTPMHVLTTSRTGKPILKASIPLRKPRLVYVVTTTLARADGSRITTQTAFRRHEHAADWLSCLVKRAGYESR